MILHHNSGHSVLFKGQETLAFQSMTYCLRYRFPLSPFLLDLDECNIFLSAAMIIKFFFVGLKLIFGKSYKTFYSRNLWIFVIS
jgi:hypothetical protein